MNDELTLIEDSNIEQTYSDQIDTLSEVITDTSEIMSDTETMVAAQEAGLLSSVALTMYAGRVENYLTRNFGSKEIRSINLCINTAGLESDNPADLQAGLEGIKEILKETGRVLWDMIKKAFANFVNFFAGLYNKWQTRTGAIEKQLNELLKSQALYGTIKVKGSDLNAIYDLYPIAATASNASNTDAREPLDLLSNLLTMANEVKLPNVSLAAKVGERLDNLLSKISFFSYSNMEKPETLEQSIISILVSKKIITDTGALKSSTRIISMSKAAINAITFGGSGELILLSNNIDEVAMSKVESTIKRFEDEKEYEIDGKAFKKLIDEVVLAIKNLNGKFRKESENRIDSLKKASDELMSMMSKVSRAESGDAGGDAEFNKEKWQMANKEINDVWKTLPKIVNQSTKNLFDTISTISSTVMKLTGTKDESTEEKKEEETK